VSDEEMVIPDQALKAARSVARRVQHTARGLLDYDDLVSVGYEWLVKHPEKAVEWCENGTGYRALRTSLYRAMGRQVAKERRRRIGDSGLSDQMYYTPGLIEELLPQVWDLHARVTQGVTDGERRGRSSPSEGNNHAAMLADVTHAVSRMPSDVRALLRARYLEGLTYEQVGELIGVSADTAARRMDSYLHTLIDLLGGERPWPSRRPRTRAAAQAAVESDYAGSGHDD
jgi:RNA polymerase sigma factor (sigma-70 family)